MCWGGRDHVAGELSPFERPGQCAALVSFNFLPCPSRAYLCLIHLDALEGVLETHFPRTPSSFPLQSPKVRETEKYRPPGRFAVTKTPAMGAGQDSCRGKQPNSSGQKYCRRPGI